MRFVDDEMDIRLFPAYGEAAPKSNQGIEVVGDFFNINRFNLIDKIICRG